MGRRRKGKRGCPISIGWEDALSRHYRNFVSSGSVLQRPGWRVSGGDGRDGRKGGSLARGRCVRDGLLGGREAVGGLTGEGTGGLVEGSFTADWGFRFVARLGRSLWCCWWWLLLLRGSRGIFGSQTAGERGGGDVTEGGLVAVTTLGRLLERDGARTVVEAGDGRVGVDFEGDLKGRSPFELGRRDVGWRR